MSAKYIKVESVGVVINGKPAGSIVEMTEAEANHYESLGYVKREAPKSKPTKKSTSATKKTATKSETK